MSAPKKIETRLDYATSQYLCTGECVHYPEVAEAWLKGGTHRVTVSSADCGLFGHDLVEKAVAILRAQRRGMSS
jgi:hypothetical protein